MVSLSCGLQETPFTVEGWCILKDLYNTSSSVALHKSCYNIVYTLELVLHEAIIPVSSSIVLGKWVYHQTSNINHTKSYNINVSHLVLQLCLPNPFKPGVESRMKMWLEQRRQAMLQLHPSDQQFHYLLRCDLYKRFYDTLLPQARQLLMHAHLPISICTELPANSLQLDSGLTLVILWCKWTNLLLAKPTYHLFATKANDAHYVQWFHI